MFASLSERVAAAVRWLLVIGWIVLIVSLFHDPWTAWLNDPANATSPFVLNNEAQHGAGMEEMNWACPIVVGEGAEETVDWQGYPEGECDPRCTRIQGECVIERTYPMGARFFWTMALPLLPFFFLVFGHEAWRRICPLSAVMQIPRKLGIQRKKKKVNPRTGKVETSLHFISPDGFLGRNFWFVQFFLLCLGVTIRLLFINSDRLALGIFFIAVIVIAMAVGYFFGGKTWCQYICPLSPVQKAYTEPRGLLESSAHESSSKITQSMCRRIDAQGHEVSNCVGCIAPCPDINLERQYWSRLEQPGRRFFYYGYIGMILGFYIYYTFYAGNWEYYFSGAWTHEEGQISRLFGPGFFIGGHAVGPPKIIAAPLTIAAFVFTSYGVGRLIEGAWARWRESRGRPLTNEERLHKAYTVAAFVAINCFYFFGGRPNINLLPDFGVTMVDLSIVGITAIWAGRTFLRTSDRFTRETVAGGLRRQLSKLSLNFREILGGRSIEQLSTDEVYVVAKTLPAMSTEQRRTTYKETLRDAMQRGLAETPAGASMLQQVRDQLDITDDEHEEILSDLGLEGAAIDADDIAAQEKQWRMDGYRESVASLVERLVETGMPMRDALARDDVRDEVARLQGAYSVTDEEHSLVMGQLVGSQGVLVQRANALVDEIRDLEAFGLGLEQIDLSTPVLPLLASIVAAKRHERITRGFTVLASLGNTPEAHAIAGNLAATDPEGATEALDTLRWHEGQDLTWREILAEGTLSVIEKQVATSLSVERPVDALDPRSAEGLDRLEIVAREWTPAARAAALVVLGELDSRAKTIAREIVADTKMTDWLLTQTAVSIATEASTTGSAIEVVGRLQATALFSRVPPSLLARLARHAEVRTLAEGDVICREGEASRDVFCLSSGRARALVQTSAGEPTEVGQIEPGQTIGELGVLTNRPRSATVIAAADETTVIQVDGNAFERFLERDARDVLRVVSERLVATLDQLRR